MIRLRHFEREDAPALQRYMYPDMTVEDVGSMIDDWNTCSYEGRPFEMFAVAADGHIAGCASLRGQSKTVASMGVHIFPDERRKGIGSKTVLSLFQTAAERGYGIILDQVRQDNGASIRLHEKCGFESDGYVYRNRRDHRVLLYLKPIG